MLSVVFAIVAAAGDAGEQVRLGGRRRQHSNRDGGSADQQDVPDDAGGQEGVAADREREADGPHDAQCLEHIVAHGDVGDVPEGAHFVVEDEVPSMDDRISVVHPAGMGAFAHTSNANLPCRGMAVARADQS